MAISLQLLAHLLEVEGVYKGAIKNFQQDSRLVKEGDLFFALKGEKVDGHQFLKAVAAKKAKAAIVCSDYQGDHYGLQLLKVPDVLKALQQLAQAVQSQRKGQVIAITGSVGKTTMKEFLSQILENYFEIAKTPGNANSQVGLPLSLLNVQGDPQVYVLEMGMSHPGEIERLVSIAPPDFAVVTSVGMVHSAFFPEGVEAIARAKAEIFSQTHTKRAFVQANVLSFKAFQKLSIPLFTYGHRQPESDFTSIPLQKRWSIVCKQERSAPFFLPFQAHHLCENAVGAAVVAHALGLSWEEIAVSLQQLQPLEQRFECVEKQGVTFVNDSYNASPPSMKAALSSLPQPVFGKKRIAILGSMKELGVYEELAHKEVAQEALKHIDHLVCLGKECAPMLEVFSSQGKTAELFLDFSSLQQAFNELIEKGDVVLIKGSNSHGLWRLLADFKV